jgi:hypothetical protein
MMNDIQNYLQKLSIDNKNKKERNNDYEIEIKKDDQLIKTVRSHSLNTIDGENRKNVIKKIRILKSDQNEIINIENDLFKAKIQRQSSEDIWISSF